MGSLEDQHEFDGIYVHLPDDEIGRQPSIFLDCGMSGPKRYLRFWPRSGVADWGWGLSDDAICLWRRQ